MKKRVISASVFLSMLVLILGLSNCKNEQPSITEKVKAVTVNISEDLAWSERMGMSIMKRAPEAWMNDFRTKPKWSYTFGIVLGSLIDLGDQKKNPIYFDYAKGYGDTMIYADGKIRGYDIAAFNIDNIAPGPFLFHCYRKTKDERYLAAINTLKYQTDWQPRTTEGGYWHKLRYPWQMWLDGLFMGEPFLGEYATAFDEPELFDHIAEQFILAEKHTRDAETGLLYHGWDESRVQRWANKETGCSQHFWARAVGWYCMGLVDVLEFFPENHPKRGALISILDRTLQSVLKVQDPKTKTWWQVLNLPGKEGNYLESTSSCMFTYAMIKGVNNGWLDEKYRPIAKASYQGILDNFIRTEESGEIHLTQGCAVAGLGGNPYRDGSYEYYIGEPIRENDAKGLGPFIWASLEFEKVGKQQ